MNTFPAAGSVRKVPCGTYISNHTKQVTVGDLYSAIIDTENEIVRNLGDAVLAEVPTLLAVADSLADLDAAVSLAAAAQEFGCVELVAILTTVVSCSIPTNFPTATHLPYSETPPRSRLVARPAGCEGGSGLPLWRPASTRSREGVTRSRNSALTRSFRTTPRSRRTVIGSRWSPVRRLTSV